MNLRSVHARMGIRGRVAIAIVIALIALQALAVMQVLLLSNRTLPFVSIGWISDTANTLAKTAFALPPANRLAALQALPDTKWLEIEWQEDAPVLETHGALRGISLRLKRAIEAKAETSLTSVRTDMGADLQPMPFRLLDYRVIPEDQEQRLTGFEVSNEADFLIPGFFRIGLQGPDGTWIVISAIPASVWTWPLAPLIGGGIVIAILSTLTTRRILEPFKRLADAAERFGTERAATPVSTENLGELTPIAETYNAMLQRLKRFVDDRTQMLAAISHDLRTSLTRLRLAALEVNDKRQRASLDGEIEQMEAMIEATLLFAKADLHAEPTRPLDLAALLISLADQACDAGNAVTYNGPDHRLILGRPQELKRAFANIITNAVNYGGEARIELSEAPTGIIVRIADSGPGIPAEKFEEAFIPFRRLDPARSRDKGGVGLGLTIARDIIQAHGGRINLENGFPHGLIVTIELRTPYSS